MNDIEQLCNLQHKMWQKFVSKLVANTRQDGSVLIKSSTVNRWKELLETDFKDLPEKVQQNIQNSVSDYVVGNVIEEMPADPSNPSDILADSVQSKDNQVDAGSADTQPPKPESKNVSNTSREKQEDSNSKKLFGRQ